MVFTQEQLDKFYGESYETPSDIIYYSKESLTSVDDFMRDKLNLETVEISFVRLTTEEEVANALEYIERENCDMLTFTRAIDSESFQPMVYIIAPRKGEILSSAFKFATTLQLKGK